MVQAVPLTPGRREGVRPSKCLVHERSDRYHFCGAPPAHARIRSACDDVSFLVVLTASHRPWHRTCATGKQGTEQNLPSQHVVSAQADRPTCFHEVFCFQCIPLLLFLCLSSCRLAFHMCSPTYRVYNMGSATQVLHHGLHSIFRAFERRLRGTDGEWWRGCTPG